MGDCSTPETNLPRIASETAFIQVPVIKKARFIDVANIRTPGTDVYMPPAHYLQELPVTSSNSGEMHRSKSYNVLINAENFGGTPFFATSNSFYSSNPSVEQQLNDLQTEIAMLKRKLSLLEGSDMWGLRYSRRMAIFTNLWVGAVLFGSTFFEHIRRKKREILQVVVPGAIAIAAGGATGRSHKLKSKSNRDPFSILLSESTFYALQHSWAFFLAAFLLMRSVAWKRFIGIMVSSGCSLYLSLVLRYLPWMSYFNLFTNAIYVTAAFNHTTPDRAPTLKDYLFSRLDEQEK